MFIHSHVFFVEFEYFLLIVKSIGNFIKIGIGMISHILLYYNITVMKV